MEELFPKHPNGQQTTLGKSEHLKNPSMKAIHQYFNDFYVPNNMAMVLVGDLEFDETKEHIVDKLNDDEIMILALGMIKYWLKPKILRDSNLHILYSDTNFNQKSPATLMEQLQSLKKNSENEFEQRCTDYTYSSDFDDKGIGWY